MDRTTPSSSSRSSLQLSSFSTHLTKPYHIPSTQLQASQHHHLTRFQMARQIAPTPHLIWAAGHFLTFFCGLRYIISAVTLRGASSRWYTVAYLGALVSYGVVVYNRFGVPQVSKAWLQRAVMEENVQYLFLALYWWINKPIFRGYDSEMSILSPYSSLTALPPSLTRTQSPWYPLSPSPWCTSSTLSPKS